MTVHDTLLTDNELLGADEDTHCPLTRLMMSHEWQKMFFAFKPTGDIFFCLQYTI